MSEAIWSAEDTAPLVEAIEALKAAEKQLDQAFGQTFNIGDEVHWFTYRGGRYHRQKGVIEIVGSADRVGDRCMRVVNSRTSKAVWLSLYDLRFFLRQMEPDPDRIGGGL